MKKLEPHSLYLVKDSQMKLLTEAQAAHLALMADVEVTNMYELLDLEPEMLEVGTYTDIT
jgi:hypothetical protein